MLQLGQVLRGRLGSYVLSSRLQDTVWKATHQRLGTPVIVKNAPEWRIRNERDMLLRFQDRGPFRRLLDEVVVGKNSESALVLRYLDSDILRVCDRRRLTTHEYKSVAKTVLLALDRLHQEGFIHTDIKPNNILVNLDAKGCITDVQLADLEATMHQNREMAMSGTPVGTPIFRSPEATLGISWKQSTDLWSFGTTLISLIYGDGIHIFLPDVPVDHDEYTLRILKRHYEYFGPFPETYLEIATGDQIGVLTWIMKNTPVEAKRPFRLVDPQELAVEDRDFLLKIMKLDPRDRPTARELLKDEWFASSP
ncbi:kinase-like domain-containing protein [Elsinoe ampelina]|uniref:Kinase-like domain-containing protein n=1 Tax=Elsinoe ampelina TaxID=302913 RepID=A0A6A6GIJ6_9PEZI|nr:kinase-like domain-containing protein [Elsinoe ampelina]